MDYLIVGAGLSGAVLAERLARRPGNHIYIIEKKKHIAGTCYDYYDKNGILVHGYGPHIFNTYDNKVWKYVNQFADFLLYHHRVLGMVDGALVPIPFNLKSIHTLFPDKLANSLTEKLVNEYGYNAKVPILELQMQNDQELKFLANFIYEKVFLHYTLKQWGMRPEDVGSGAMARIPVFISTDDRYFQAPYQGVPKLGYTDMIKNMLSAPNIAVVLGMDYKEILSLNKTEKSISVYNIPFKGKVIFTACLDELFDYEYGQLPYRTLKFHFETYDCPSYQPVATVNYPNDYEFTRITEFKKLTQQKNPKTVIMKEFPQQYDSEDKNLDPFYPIPTKENEAMYSKYLQLARGYSSLIVAGRLANYKYYTMADTVANALLLADTLDQ
ncbi:UDP-galactopyranose mutase [Clostridium sp. W14A]|jgi:UDP-galactopyranose mutase|nr:UDP-galactopyranose mutase [Clostridium sp. W14A]